MYACKRVYVCAYDVIGSGDVEDCFVASEDRCTYCIVLSFQAG